MHQFGCIPMSLQELGTRQPPMHVIKAIAACIALLPAACIVPLLKYQAIDQNDQVISNAITLSDLLRAGP